MGILFSVKLCEFQEAALRFITLRSGATITGINNNEYQITRGKVCETSYWDRIYEFIFFRSPYLSPPSCLFYFTYFFNHANGSSHVCHLSSNAWKVGT